MVGLGTMMQDPYGWVIDANGDPELYYFIGSVVGYPFSQPNGNVPQNDLSQKLYKIKFTLNGQGQHDMDTSGAYPVGKIKPTLVDDLVEDYPPDVNNDNNTRVYGGLTFISRDVFLLGSSYRPGENENPPGYNVHVATTLYANKLNAAGTAVSNTKIWNRKILKQGTTDSQNNWPGTVAGFSFVPPESNLFDVEKKAASIVALTGAFPYGGPWSFYGGGNDTGQNHKNQILRLDTVDTAIGNNYYEASSSWRDLGSTSSWKLISQIGNCGVQPNADWDQAEGWMAFDSKGNMYYGSVAWYFGTSVGGPPYEPYGSTPPLQTETPQYMHDVARIDAPVSNGGGDNQKIMHFNSVLPASTFRNGSLTYDWTNALHADAGCCDIYGQSLYGKDSLWLFVNRNKHKTNNSAASYNKKIEGLWVIKRNGTNNSFDVLAHYELDDTGTDGWDNVTGLSHDTTPTITMSMLECGMSFRPCAKRHV